MHLITFLSFFLITFQVVSKVTSHIGNPKKKKLLTPPLTNQTAFKQGGTTQILASLRNQFPQPSFYPKAIVHMLEKSSYWGKTLFISPVEAEPLVPATKFMTIHSHTMQLSSFTPSFTQSLGGEDPLEKGMATHSSILAYRIPWTEKPDGLECLGLQRVRTEWLHFQRTFYEGKSNHK